MKKLKKSEEPKTTQAEEGKEKDPSESNKETKKLFDSAVGYLTHRLGRAPTIEEIANALITEPEKIQATEKEEKEAEEKQVASSIPKLLTYKIHYGMSKSPEGKTQPDPMNILYYVDQEGNRAYDCKNRCWTPDIPDIVQHLPGRDLEDSPNGEDVREAIIHGVMGEDDYNALDSRGLISDKMKQLYSLIGKLNTQTQALETMEKSTEDYQDQLEGGLADNKTPADFNKNKLAQGAKVESEHTTNPNIQKEIAMDHLTEDPNYYEKLQESEVDPGEFSVNALREFQRVTGSENTEPYSSNDDEEGENVYEEISSASKGTGIEARMRKWIREELEELKNELRAEIWQSIHQAANEWESQQDSPDEEVIGEYAEPEDEELEDEDDLLDPEEEAVDDL
jgi:hypothetical protein